MKTYLALARKSTDKQEVSLDYQLRIIAEHPVTASMRCLGEYADIGTGRVVAMRDELAKAFARCKKNAGEIDYLLCQKWDRLGRNLAATASVIEEFGKLGVQVNAVEQWIDWAAVGSTYTLLGLYLGQAADESNRIGRRTQDALYHLRLQGHWMNGRLPFGYLKHKEPTSGRKLLIPDPDRAPILTAIFEQYALGRYDKAYLFRQYPLLRTNGKPVSYSNFFSLFHRNVYAGLINVPAHGTHPARTVPGLHEPLITMEVFEAMQLAAKQKNNGRNLRIMDHAKEKFYLKGHIMCALTGDKLTASASKGRSKRYEYYHGSTPQHQRISVREAHKAVEMALKDFHVEPSEQAEIERHLRAQVRKKTRSIHAERDSAIARVKDIEARIAKLMDDYADGRLTLEEYRAMKARQTSLIPPMERAARSAELNLEQVDRRMLDALKAVFALDKAFQGADHVRKDQILAALFPEGFSVKNGRLRTGMVNIFLREMLSTSGNYQHIDIEKGANEAPSPNVGYFLELSRTHKALLQRLAG